MQEQSDISRHIGTRIREERTRLGMNQTDFAALAGATKRVGLSWEKGETPPTAVALTQLANSGVDILYVIAGRREGAGRSGLSLSEAEVALDELERSAQSDEARSKLDAIARDASLPDRVRARADAALFIMYRDSDAETRQAAREEQRSFRAMHMEVMARIAFTRAGRTPAPRQVLAALVRLLMLDPAAPTDTIQLALDELATAIQELQAQ